MTIPATLKKRIDGLTYEDTLLAHNLSQSIIGKILKIRDPKIRIYKQLDDPNPFELDWFDTIWKGYQQAFAKAGFDQNIQVLFQSVQIIDGKPQFPNAALDAFNLSISEGINAEFSAKAIQDAESILREMYSVASEASAAALRVTPKLTAIDEATIQVLKETDNFLLSSMHQRNVANKANQKAIEVLTEGFGERELARRLEEEVGETILLNSRANIKVIANDTINKARNFSRINQYEKIGIQTYEFIAILDERTTPMCRYMNGRTFSTETSLGIVEDVMNFGVVDDDNLEKFKTLRPWGNVDNKRLKAGQNAIFIKDARGAKTFLPDSSFRFTESGGIRANGNPNDAGVNGKLQNKRFVFPPLHANCRSTVVMSETEVERLTGSVVVTKLEGNTIAQQFENIAENSANGKPLATKENFNEIRQDVADAVGAESSKLDTVDSLMDAFRKNPKSKRGMKFQARNHVANGFTATSQFTESFSDSQIITFRAQVRAVKRDTTLLEAYQISRAVNRSGLLKGPTKNTITIYRGIVGKAAKDLIKIKEDGLSNVILKVMPLTQWSRSKKVAEKFIKEFGTENGVIVRYEIQVEDNVFSHRVHPILDNDHEELIYGDTSGFINIPVKDISKIKIEKQENVSVSIDSGKNHNWIWNTIQLMQGLPVDLIIGGAIGI